VSSATTPLSVRFASTSETALVASVLEEAHAWLCSRGEPLWTHADLLPVAIAKDVAAAQYVLVPWKTDALATARLTLSDPQFWPDAAAGEALYLHRLAVRRGHAGRGVAPAVLDWCRAHARALGCRFLRLDCDARRPRLRQVYEDFGFAFHSERSIGPYTAARYQLPT